LSDRLMLILLCLPKPSFSATAELKPTLEVRGEYLKTLEALLDPEFLILSLSVQSQ